MKEKLIKTGFQLFDQNGLKATFVQDILQDIFVTMILKRNTY